MYNKTDIINLKTAGENYAESKEYMRQKVLSDRMFIPKIDYSDPANFVHYGMAEEYYTQSISYILNTYPYDGSYAEKQKWYNESSYLDKYVFDSEYPRTNGYIILSSGGWGSVSSTIGGVGLSSTPEYILFHGGPNTDSEFEKSNLYDETLGLKSNLEFGTQNTVEFYIKKAAANVNTDHEVILDVWNLEEHGTSDYSRLVVAIDSSGATPEFRIVHKVKNVGIEQTISNSGFIFDSEWHHYAISFEHSGSALEMKFYRDGAYITNSTHSYVVSDNVEKNIRGCIGAYQTETSALANMVLGYGKLDASIDEFRFWKEVRTPRQIGQFYNMSVGGGTNTDENNTSLGVYFKFNEGITGESKYDLNVLDYSGRLSNGRWYGYPSSSARNIGSAMALGGFVTSEYEDVILYENHPDVLDYIEDRTEKGRVYDLTNNYALYKNVPSWLVDEDEGEELKRLCQIMGSYFDTLRLQIGNLVDIKIPDYEDVEDFGNIPFGSKLLSSVGFVEPDLFNDATIFERFFNQNEEGDFEEKLSKVKNFIYTNIYRNLTYIFKSKGTENSFRSLLRSVGIDDELVKLHVYADNTEVDMSEEKKYESSIKKRFLKFSNSDNHGATVFNKETASPVDGEAYYMPNNSLEYVGTTRECEVIFPKLDSIDERTTHCIFGARSVFPGDNVLVWDLAGFDYRVYSVRDTNDPSYVKFRFVSTSAGLTLESDWYKDVYDNTRWVFAVRVVNDEHPNADKTGVNTNYNVEFYGTHYRYGRKVASFEKVGSAFSNGLYMIYSDQRHFVGAQRTDFTGSITNPTTDYSDCWIGSNRYWIGLLDNDTIDRHAEDPDNFGTTNPIKPYTIGQTAVEPDGNVPEMETLVYHWVFDTVSEVTSGGVIERIEDYSDGGVYKEGRYSVLSDLVAYQYPARGFGFVDYTLSECLTNEYLHATRQGNPEDSQSIDSVYLKQDYELEKFQKNMDKKTYKYSFEKSMYQVISDEMYKFFSTLSEFGETFGEGVDRYRMGYKKLEKLRMFFFERIQNVPEVEKFIGYYRWIDESVSMMLKELVPAGGKFSAVMNEIIESHALERSKYWSKFPLVKSRDEEFSTTIQNILCDEEEHDLQYYTDTEYYFGTDNTSLVEGLEVYYPLHDNTTGDTHVRDFLNHYHGNLEYNFTGAPPYYNGYYSSQLHTTGVIDGAFDFDGTNHFFRIPTYLNRHISPRSPYSISMWINPDADGVSDQALFSGLESGGDGFLFARNSSNKIFIEFNNVSVMRATTSETVLAADGWTHIVLIFSGVGGADGFSIIINGVPATLTRSYGDVGFEGVCSYTVSVGGDITTNYDHFDGQICEVGLWSCALTGFDAQDLYNSGSGLELKRRGVSKLGSEIYSEVDTYSAGSVNLTDGLVAYYELNDNVADKNIVNLVETGHDGLFSVNTSTKSVAGKVGTALDFSGDQQAKLNIENVAGEYFQIGKPFTWSGWVYVPAMPGNYHGFWGNTHSTSIKGIRTAIFPSVLYSGSTYDRFAITINQSAANYRRFISDNVDGDVFTASTWHYVVFQYNGGDINLPASFDVYVNDMANALTLVTNLTGGTIGSIRQKEFYLGYSYDTAAYRFAGYLDSFGAWERELTQAERVALYNSGNGIAITKSTTQTTYKDAFGTGAVLPRGYNFDDKRYLAEHIHSYYQCEDNAANTDIVDYVGEVNFTSTVNTDQRDVTGIINGGQDTRFLDYWLDSSGNLNNLFRLFKPFSLSVWVNTDTYVSPYRTIITTQNASVTAGILHILIQNTGLIYFGFKGESGSTDRVMINTRSPSIGSWSHIAITYDGSGTLYGAKFYLDAIEENNYSVAGPVESVDSFFYDTTMWDHPDPVNYKGYDGQVDEIGIWDRQLTSEEVSELYNSGAARTISTLSLPSVDTLDTECSDVYNVQANKVAESEGVIDDVYNVQNYPHSDDYSDGHVGNYNNIIDVVHTSGVDVNSGWWKKEGIYLTNSFVDPIINYFEGYSSLMTGLVDHISFENEMNDTMIRTDYGDNWVHASRDFIALPSILSSTTSMYGQSFYADKTKPDSMVSYIGGRGIEKAAGEVFGNKAFTIGFWAKNDAALTSLHFLATTDDGTSGVTVGVNSGGKVYLYIRSSAANYISCYHNTVLLTNSWTFVCVSYDGSGSSSGMTVYVNADSTNQVPASAGVFNSSSVVAGGDFSIADGTWVTFSPYDGYIDEVSVWSRELTAAEVGYLYNSGSGLQFMQDFPRVTTEYRTNVFNQNYSYDNFVKYGSRTGNSHVFGNRFSSPGDKRVSGGYLDKKSQEISAYNAIPWRNMEAIKQVNEEWK